LRGRRKMGVQKSLWIAAILAALVFLFLSIPKRLARLQPLLSKRKIPKWRSLAAIQKGFVRQAPMQIIRCCGEKAAFPKSGWELVRFRRGSYN